MTSTRIRVDVVKAVSAPLAPAFMRGVLEKAALLPELAARLPGESATIAVRITGDRELSRLHRDFAGDDSVTDVLAFAGEGDHLGDLAISWPMAERQAKAHGHPPATELALLGVHGMLHLMGWDHMTAAQRREMTRLTHAALELSGLNLSPGRI